MQPPTGQRSSSTSSLPVLDLPAPEVLLPRLAALGNEARPLYVSFTVIDSTTIVALLFPLWAIREGQPITYYGVPLQARTSGMSLLDIADSFRDANVLASGRGFMRQEVARPKGTPHLPPSFLFEAAPPEEEPATPPEEEALPALDLCDFSEALRSLDLYAGTLTWWHEDRETLYGAMQKLYTGKKEILPYLDAFRAHGFAGLLWHWLSLVIDRSPPKEDEPPEGFGPAASDEQRAAYDRYVRYQRYWDSYAKAWGRIVGDTSARLKGFLAEAQAYVAEDAHTITSRTFDTLSADLEEVYMFIKRIVTVARLHVALRDVGEVLVAPWINAWLAEHEATLGRPDEIWLEPNQLMHVLPLATAPFDLHGTGTTSLVEAFRVHHMRSALLELALDELRQRRALASSSSAFRHAHVYYVNEATRHMLEDDSTFFEDYCRTAYGTTSAEKHLINHHTFDGEGLCRVLEEARTLKIHAHGLVDPDDPTRSKIAFCEVGDDGATAFLPVQRIEGLDLTGLQMVELLICDGAYMEPDLFDEGMSIALAFLSAGARCVVGYLFPVLSAVGSVVSEGFWRAWATGMPAYDAYQAALAYAREHATLTPHTRPLWSSFVLYGDGSVTIHDV